MKNIYFLIIAFICFTFCPIIGQGQWTTVTADATNDHSNKGLFDGLKLEYKGDPNTDSLWFRITVATATPGNYSDIGVNVMVNVPGLAGTFNFWGNDNKQAWHKLITTWVTGSAPSSYSGTIGIANSTGVNAQNYTNLSANNISIVSSISANTIILGLKRKDLIPDANFGTNTMLTVKVAAAVGSHTNWNDDIYAANGVMVVTKKSTTSAQTPAKTALGFQVYPNPAKGVLYIDYANTGTGETLTITDVVGKKVKEITPSAIAAGINISDLQAGVYFVNLILADNTIITKKLIIE